MHRETTTNAPSCMAFARRRSISIDGQSSKGQRLLRATQRRAARITGFLRSNNATRLSLLIRPPGVKGAHAETLPQRSSITPVEMIRREKSPQEYGTDSLFRLQNQTMTELKKLGGIFASVSAGSDVAYLHAAQSRLYSHATSDAYNGINRTQARSQTVIGTTIVTREMHRARPATAPTNRKVTTLRKRPPPVDSNNRYGKYVDFREYLKREERSHKRQDFEASDKRGTAVGDDRREGAHVSKVGVCKPPRNLGKLSGRWGSYLTAQSMHAPSHNEVAHPRLISNSLSHAMLGPRHHTSRFAELHHHVARPLSAAAVKRNSKLNISGNERTGTLLSPINSQLCPSEASRHLGSSYCGLGREGLGISTTSPNISSIAIPQSQQSGVTRVRGIAMYHSVTSKGKEHITSDPPDFEDASHLSLSDGELSCASNSLAESVASPWGHLERGS